MILHSEDYQFQRTVPFVRIDEYHNEQRAKSLRDRWRAVAPAQYKQSLLRFHENGQLLSCSSQSNGNWREEVQHFYQDDLLIKRVFTAHNAHGIQGSDSSHVNYSNQVSGTVYREENHIYNEHKLLKEKNLLEGDTLQQRTFYSYNENFQLIREENLQNTKLYFYNDADLCHEECIYIGSEHIKTLRYRYDDQGNIAELWEESPVGQTSRLHKYVYNQHNLLSCYQLINQDGLILSNLEYRYNNFIDQDWLERYTWRLSGRAGKISYQPTHTCLRSPTIERSSEELTEYLRRDYKVLELPEGKYYGQARLGIMHGLGCLDFFDGSCYIGHFDTGRMDGYGSFYWPDGRIYQGYFSNNQMEGRGSYYLADGSLYQGSFAEGQLLSSQQYYFLAGDSPNSRANRQARQAQELARCQISSGADDLADNGASVEEYPEQIQEPQGDQAFIEAATKAVQQRMHGQALQSEAESLEQAEAEQHQRAIEEREVQRQAEEQKAVEEAKLLQVRQQQIAYAKAKTQVENQAKFEVQIETQVEMKSLPETEATSGLQQSAEVAQAVQTVQAGSELIIDESQESDETLEAAEYIVGEELEEQGSLEVVPPPAELFSNFVGHFGEAEKSQTDVAEVEDFSTELEAQSELDNEQTAYAEQAMQVDWDDGEGFSEEAEGEPEAVAMPLDMAAKNMPAIVGPESEPELEQGLEGLEPERNLDFERQLQQEFQVYRAEQEERQRQQEFPANPYVPTAEGPQANGELDFLWSPAEEHTAQSSESGLNEAGALAAKSEPAAVRTAMPRNPDYNMLLFAEEQGQSEQFAELQENVHVQEQMETFGRELQRNKDPFMH